MTSEVDMGNLQPATDRSADDGARPDPDGDTTRRRGEDAPAGRRRAAVSAGHRGDTATAMRLLEDPDPSVRATALGALARAGALGPAVVSRGLADPEGAVRRRACEEAGRAIAAGAVDQAGTGALLAALRAALEDPEDAVAESAAWAVGEAGARAGGAVAALSRMAAGHRAALCREAAVAALGAVGDSGGLQAVLEALGDRPAIRRRAAVALAAFDDPRAEAGLRRCLEDRDWQVRQAAEELVAGED